MNKNGSDGQMARGNTESGRSNNCHPTLKSPNQPRDNNTISIAPTYDAIKPAAWEILSGTLHDNKECHLFSEAMKSILDPKNNFHIFNFMVIFTGCEYPMFFI